MTIPKSVFTIIGLVLTNLGPVVAQQPSTSDAMTSIYRETPARINDLVNTRLDVRFDYKKRYLYGKEWVTLKPHCYATDTLRLDAKGMDLNDISLVKNGKYTPLTFSYDGLIVTIKLNRVYRRNEPYTVYIAYTSKPDQLKQEGDNISGAAKGLY